MAAAQQIQVAVEQERDVDSNLAGEFDSEQSGWMCLQHRYLAGALEPMWAELKAADFAAEEVPL